MFTKIAAGLVAAAVVTGAGVYFAYTGTEGGCHKCPIQRMMESNNNPESSECGESRGCCLPVSAEPNTALAACAGGTAMETTTKTASSNAPCCAVE